MLVVRSKKLLIRDLKLDLALFPYDRDTLNDLRVSEKKKSNISRRVRKELKAKKRAKRAIKESRKKLLAKTVMKSISSGKKVQLVSHNERKMSDIIIEFAEPLLDQSTSIEEDKVAIKKAIHYWNIFVLPKNYQSKYEDMMQALQKASRDEASSEYLEDENDIMSFMKDRKEKLFPDNHRVILNYECIDTPDGVHLNVAYDVSDLKQQE